MAFSSEELCWRGWSAPVPRELPSVELAVEGAACCAGRAVLEWLAAIWAGDGIDCSVAGLVEPGLSGFFSEVDELLPADDSSSGTATLGGALVLAIGITASFRGRLQCGHVGKSDAMA